MRLSFGRLRSGSVIGLGVCETPGEIFGSRD